MSQVKTRIGLFLCSAALMACWPALAQEFVPSAQEVLSLVRAHESRQHRDLTGRIQMSSSEGRTIVPFKLQMRPGKVSWQFSDPNEILSLQFAEKESHLIRHVDGKNEGLKGKALSEMVRGTDLTFEDLSLRFLYWNNAKVIGSETLKTRKCWVVEALPDQKEDSQYDRVRLWIEGTGGLMKAECFAGGKLHKRFQVQSVQNLPRGGGYILKTMTIQTLDEQGRDRSPTRLVIDSPNPR